MYKSGSALHTDVDFENAIMFQLPVEVWQHGQLLDYGGRIDRYTADAVTINEAKYLRAVANFGFAETALFLIPPA